MNPNDLCAKLRHETKVTNLRRAIDLMAHRYGDAVADFYLAHVTGNGDIAARHRRSSNRRYAALQRLTKALADLAIGGAQ